MVRPPVRMVRPPVQMGDEWRQWWLAGTAPGRPVWEQALQQVVHAQNQKVAE